MKRKTIYLFMLILLPELLYSANQTDKNVLEKLHLLSKQAS